jgi:hypothetical protein
MRTSFLPFAVPELRGPLGAIDFMTAVAHLAASEGTGSATAPVGRNLPVRSASMAALQEG